MERSEILSKQEGRIYFPKLQGSETRQEHLKLWIREEMRIFFLTQGVIMVWSLLSEKGYGQNPSPG